MDPELRVIAEAATGFMPPEEGVALYEAARVAGANGPIVEIGTYCGKSAVYLGAAASEVDSVVFTIDHHRGSEEMQAGWDHHDPALVDSESGRMDSLPVFRALIERAELENHVIGIVGDSAVVGRSWSASVAMVFIDGGHGEAPAHTDYEVWSPHIAAGGFLAIHDVFPNPADGGRPPFEIFCRAVDSGDFVEHSATGSLRVLRRNPLLSP